jgi:hypothetical protein
MSHSGSTGFAAMCAVSPAFVLFEAAMHTCAVPARDELDLADVHAQVVQPVIRALLRPGEVEAVTLGWQTQRRPAPPKPVEGDAVRLDSETAKGASLRWIDVEVLVFSLVVRGELFAFDVVYSDDELAELDLAFVRDDILDRFRDFIAESRFGWGELRG